MVVMKEHRDGIRDAVVAAYVCCAPSLISLIGQLCGTETLYTHTIQPVMLLLSVVHLHLFC